MAAPTFVSYGATSFNDGTSPKSVSITTQTGDRIVVIAVAESGDSATSTAPTGNSQTFSQVASLGTTNAHARAIAWTCTETSGTTYSVSVPRPSSSSSVVWGAGVWVWRASDGFGAVGAPTVGSTSNSVTLTTTQANSGLCVASSDWNAVDGTTRTRRTINSSTGTERSYFRDSSRYTVYGQDYADCGAAGSVTGGYSAPTGQASAIIAVEVKGTSGAAAVGAVRRRNPSSGLIMRGRR